jgi:predicted aspartyl protease
VNGHFSYTAYDDFHLDASARPQAYHFQGDDGDGTTFDYRLHTDRDETAQDEALLAMPRNRRVTVEFPIGQRAVRLPARFDRKRILVHVTIGKRGFEFLLDTGASGIVLSSDAARQLGLETFGSGYVTGATELASERAIVPLLDVGGLKMRDVVLRTAPLGEEERSEHISGLLGFDFIASAVLRVDYEHGTLDAYENATFTPPAGAKVLDVRLGEQIPMTAVAVGRSVGDDFFVDTGASTSLLVFSHFASAHPRDVSDDGVGAALASSGIGVAASGIGGRIGVRPVQVRRMRFGSTTFDDPLVYVAESPHALGRETADGLVGADVLSRFTVYLDYAQSRIFLEPAGGR